MDLPQIFRKLTFKKGSSSVIGWELKVNLTPKASHTKIGEIIIDAEGHPYLRVYVTAVPEDNKANNALVEVLAKGFRIPKSKIHIISGQTDRRKLILFECDQCPQLAIKAKHL
jgi:hypothetical protein